MGKGKIGIPKDFEKMDEGFVSIQSTGWALKMMRVKLAHSKGVAGSGVVIAVGDTGVNLEHKDLPLPAGIYQGIHDTHEDEHGHGSNVLGIAYSVMPDGKFVVGKVADARGVGDFDQMVDFGYWAVKQGAKVINFSMASIAGGTDSDMEKFIDYAYEQGVIIVCAAGNENGNVGYPASNPKVIAVGAIDHNRLVAQFQNRGLELDFVAPGVQIYSAWKGDASAYASGTSQGAPYVAGLIGLIIGEYFDKFGAYPSPNEVFQILKMNSEDVAYQGFDTSSGHGLPVAAGEGTDAFVYDKEVEDDRPVACAPSFWTKIKNYFA